MQLIYEGVDITNDCDLTGCIYVDASDGSDYIELHMGNTRDFMRWQPTAGEKIQVLCDTAAGTLDSGVMSVDTVWIDAQSFSIYASAMPEAARQALNATYDQVTLGDIAGRHAAELGLNCAYYGVDPLQKISCAIRSGETMAAFLMRIMTPQTGAVKYAADRLALISRKWAGEQDVYATLQLNEQAANFALNYTQYARYKSATVRTPIATGTAQTGAQYGPELFICDAPVADNAEAAAWAAGALALANADALTLQVELDLNAALHALGHYRTTGAIDGDWLALKIEHDLINLRTSAELTEVIG